ncbi:MAG: PP2C family protein-serine/threonine phosphatase [Actinomycetota bacterium]
MDPTKILTSTNEQLLQEIPSHMFVTCLCALLDPRTGHLVYANAGHCLPYMRTAAGVREVRATGMPLGLMPGASYEGEQTSIASGDSIVFHSDGIAEAHKAAERCSASRA